MSPSVYCALTIVKSVNPSKDMKYIHEKSYSHWYLNFLVNYIKFVLFT